MERMRAGIAIGHERPTAIRPAIEVSRRRQRIRPGPRPAKPSLAARRMLLAVLDHVDQRRAHLARSEERASMVAVRDHLAAPPGQPVEPTSHPNPESLHRAPQRNLVLNLHQQMKMIALDREVDDPHPQPVPSRRQRRPDRRITPESPKRPQPANDPTSHMDRMPRRQPRPPTMPDPSPSPPSLPPRPTTSPTPPSNHRELKRKLTRAPRATPHQRSSTTPLCGHPHISADQHPCCVARRERPPRSQARGCPERCPPDQGSQPGRTCRPGGHRRRLVELVRAGGPREPGQGARALGAGQPAPDEIDRPGPGTPRRRRVQRDVGPINDPGPGSSRRTRIGEQRSSSAPAPAPAAPGRRPGGPTDLDQGRHDADTGSEMSAQSTTRPGRSRRTRIGEQRSSSAPAPAPAAPGRRRGSD